MQVSVVFLVFNLLAFEELLKSVVWDLPPAFEDSRRQCLRHLVSSSSLKPQLCPDWCALHVSWASFVVLSFAMLCLIPPLIGKLVSGLDSLGNGLWPCLWEMILFTLIHIGRLAHQWYRFSGLGRENVLYTMYGIKREREWASWAQTFLFLGFLVTDVLCLAALSFRHCDFHNGQRQKLRQNRTFILQVAFFPPRALSTATGKINIQALSDKVELVSNSLWARGWLWTPSLLFSTFQVLGL